MRMFRTWRQRDGDNNTSDTRDPGRERSVETAPHTSESGWRLQRVQFQKHLIQIAVHSCGSKSHSLLFRATALERKFFLLNLFRMPTARNQQTWQVCEVLFSHHLQLLSILGCRRNRPARPVFITVFSPIFFPRTWDLMYKHEHFRWSILGENKNL